MPAPNEITPIQLSRLIGTPECPSIIDVCIDDDFNNDPHLIPSSRRYPFTEIQDLAHELQGGKAVIICHKGLKLSQGAAALLRYHDVACEFMQGGISAWKNAGLPLIPAKKIPLQPDGSTLWVTRHRPKIDRIACPWLIRRFVDPRAKFLFVSSSEILNVAEKFNATPFDVEDCFLSHRNDQCTFDTMIAEFALDLAPLHKLATIVRGADTDRLDLAPEAAGLMAISLGLSRMHRDDLVQLNAGIGIYDAFYRWARDAFDETHNWPVKGVKGS
jgi:rhodanese-related sulfurtransferase